MVFFLSFNLDSGWIGFIKSTSSRKFYRLKSQRYVLIIAADFSARSGFNHEKSV